MLVGKKSSKKINTKLITSKIEKIKKEFGVEEHYLEKLIKTSK